MNAEMKESIIHEWETLRKQEETDEARMDRERKLETEAKSERTQLRHKRNFETIANDMSFTMGQMMGFETALNLLGFELVKDDEEMITDIVRREG